MPNHTYHYGGSVGQRVMMVICKEPREGHVKTRMCPPLTPDQAASLARASLLDTFAACQTVTCARRVAVVDGSPEGWVPQGWGRVPQRAGGLDVRLADAFEDVLGDDEVGVLIAMDTPQVSTRQLDRAFELLAGHDAVIGLTDDGGYWLIGLSHAAREVFEGVPMSTAQTGARQLERLHQLGLRVAIIEQLRDLDTLADVAVVAAEHPRLHVSRWHTGLTAERQQQ
jgi:rSAM/selenodomain-associated transferase 1